MLNKLNFAQWWLIIYAVSIVVLPPIHFRDKQFFWAEILLVPLIVVFVLRVLKGLIRKPAWPLVLTLVATAAAFVSGLHRGTLGLQFSIYPFTAPDEFALKRDGISFLRWCLIFATPWLISESLREPERRSPAVSRPSHVQLFMQALKYGVVVSALLSFAHRAHLISLADWGYFTEGLTWAGRSHGTFTAPLEAGMVYALMTLFLGLKILGHYFGNGKEPLEKADPLYFILSFASLLLTKTGTAFVAMCLGFFFAIVFTPLRHKKKIAGIAAGLVFIFVMSLPSNFILLKWNDFIARPQTWDRWIHAVPARPQIAFFGIGFSQLIVDNGVLTILIKGGLFLVTALALWLNHLRLRTPVGLKFLFVFWVLSWLALDSIGYWGIGRIMWALWGLCLLQPGRTRAPNRQS